MPVTLYEHPLSPYAQKVKIALREKGIAFDVQQPNGLGSGVGLDEFQRLNPRGEVPLLVHDQNAIYDSTIILDYIEDVWPTPCLMPDDPAERARARTIEEVMDSHYEPINWGCGEILAFQRATGDLADAILKNAAAQAQSFFRWLEQELDSKQYFCGASFGRADLSVIPYINGSATFGIVPPEGSNLAVWAEGVNARASVAITKQEAEAGGGAGLGPAVEALKAGLFKREYRDHRLEWMIKMGGLSVVTEGLEKDNIRFTPNFA